MKQFAPGFVAHIGGTVSSRSVKLLDHINCPDDPESRDTWWMELRKEIRCHCRSLACNAVLGYSEATYIWYVDPPHSFRLCQYSIAFNYCN